MMNFASQTLDFVFKIMDFVFKTMKFAFKIMGYFVSRSSLMLEFAGFDPEFGATQPPSVAMTLRILVGLVPAVLVVISGCLLYFYPITEAKRQLTRMRLAERKEVKMLNFVFKTRNCVS